MAGRRDVSSSLPPLGILSTALSGCLRSVLLTSVLGKKKAFSLLKGRKESPMK